MFWLHSINLAVQSLVGPPSLDTWMTPHGQYRDMLYLSSVVILWPPWASIVLAFVLKPQSSYVE